MRRFKLNMKRRGFTLVELLVALAVVGVFVAILVPTINSSIETGRQTQCASNLRQVHAGAMAYALDHDGIIIPIGGNDNIPGITGDEYYWWHTPIRHYIEVSYAANGSHGERAKAVLSCPSSDAVITGGAGSHFGENMHINEKSYNSDNSKADLYTLGMLTEPTRTLWFADSMKESNPLECQRYVSAGWNDGPNSVAFRHNGKANLVFFDGHIESWSREDFPVGPPARNGIPWAAQPKL